MPTLVTRYNWGSPLYYEKPELARQLDDAYTSTALVVNTKVTKYVAEANPPNSVTESTINKNLEIGDLWINKSTNAAWIMTSRTTDLLATWSQIT